MYPVKVCLLFYVIAQNSLQNEFTCVETERLVDFSVCHELSRVKDYLHVETVRVKGRA